MQLLKVFFSQRKATQGYHPLDFFFQFQNNNTFVISVSQRQPKAAVCSGLRTPEIRRYKAGLAEQDLNLCGADSVLQVIRNTVQIFFFLPLDKLSCSPTYK